MAKYDELTIGEKLDRQPDGYIVVESDYVDGSPVALGIIRSGLDRKSALAIIRQRPETLDLMSKTGSDIYWSTWIL